MKHNDFLAKALQRGWIKESEMRLKWLHGQATGQDPLKQAEAPTLAMQCFTLGMCPTKEPPADLATLWLNAVAAQMTGAEGAQDLIEELRAEELARYLKEQTQ